MTGIFPSEKKWRHSEKPWDAKEIDETERSDMATKNLLNIQTRIYSWNAILSNFRIGVFCRNGLLTIGSIKEIYSTYKHQWLDKHMSENAHVCHRRLYESYIIIFFKFSRLHFNGVCGHIMERGSKG